MTPEVRRKILSRITLTVFEGLERDLLVQIRELAADPQTRMAASGLARVVKDRALLAAKVNEAVVKVWGPKLDQGVLPSIDVSDLIPAPVANAPVSPSSSQIAEDQITAILRATWPAFASWFCEQKAAA